MVYRDSEIKQIKDYLWKAVKGDANLQNQTLPDIRNALYTHTTGDNESIYTKKKKNLEKHKDNIEGKKDKVDSKLWLQYENETAKYADQIIDLDAELKDIIEKFAEEKIAPILKLEETYKEIRASQQILDSAGIPITDTDVLTDDIAKDLASNELIEQTKMDDCINLLANHYIKQADGFLGYTDEIAPAAGQTMRNYLFTKTVSERDEIANKVNIIKESSKKRAESEIKEKLAEKKKENKEAKDAYKTIVNELNPVLNADVTHLLDDFNSVAAEYGHAKLSNNASDAEKIRKDASYVKIRDAIVKVKAHETEIDYRGNIFRLDKLYEKVISKVKNGWLSKSEANKILNEINGRVGTIKRRVDGELDDVLTSIYKNVLAGSEFDTTSLGKKKKYMIIHGDRFSEKWDESANGIHAEAGLGWYFNEFIGDEIDVLEKPGYWERTKHAGKRFWGWIAGNAAAPLENRTVRRREHSGTAGRLQSKIITKHKHAAYHDLDEKNKISIDDLVKLGLGLAIKENGEEEIISKWAKVRQLNSASSMEEILETYLEAAELGEAVNEDAKHRTKIEDRQFEWLDDYINKKAGFTYHIKDKAVDWVNGIFERAGLEKEIDLEESEGWSIHQTALKPNLYPGPIVALAGLAGIIGGYAYLHSKITGETVVKKKSSIFSIYEVVKEVLIAFGAAKIVKGKESHEEKSEAAQVKKK